MPRVKKQRLKQRPDGRYRCAYKGHLFYGRDPDEALALREEYKRQEAAGEYRRQNPTVSEYAAEWLPKRVVDVAPQTKKELTGLMQKLTAALGDRYVRDVVSGDIKGVYTEKFSGYSDSYIRAAAQLYRGMFDAAVDDGLIRTNPARKTSAKPHKGTQAESRAITAQEREWIETLCTDHRAHAAVMAMLYAGIRPQEAKAMNIDRDIDRKAGVLYVNESVHMINTNQYESTRKLKTDFSRRTVPLFAPLKKALTGRSGMLIQTAAGKPVTVQAWRSAWESYIFDLETAINGCQERWYGRRRQDKGRQLPPFIKVTFTPYDLRHSFCKMCRDQNVEINTCIHWMGHKDAKMILRIYDEYTPERSRNEAEKVEKIFDSGSAGGSNQETPAKTPAE